MIKIHRPRTFPSYMEQSLCCVMALRLLDSEPEKLTDKAINHALDVGKHAINIRKIYPCPAHTMHVRNMHHNIFSTLSQVINPRDLLTINALEMNRLQLSTASKSISAIITLKYKREGVDYQFRFKINYKSNFSVKAILLCTEVPTSSALATLQFRRPQAHYPISSTVPLPEIIPVQRPSGYQQNRPGSIPPQITQKLLPPTQIQDFEYQPSPIERWDFDSFAVETKQHWRLHAEKGILPNDFQEIRTTLVAAIAPNNKHHNLLVNICRQEPLSRQTVEELMIDLLHIFVNKHADAFGILV